MSQYFAVATLPWEWVCIGGGLGGALNAAISSNLRPWPSWSRPRAGRRIGPLTRVGLIVNAAAGVLASMGLLLALRGMLDVDEAAVGGVPIRLMAWSLFVGFATAHGVTSEVDKVLLRLAVRSAAAAPAAHPQVAEALDHAPPYAVYQLATGLLPRGRSGPPGRIHVRASFDSTRPQGL